MAMIKGENITIPSFIPQIHVSSNANIALIGISTNGVELTQPLPFKAYEEKGFIKVEAVTIPQSTGMISTDFTIENDRQSAVYEAEKGKGKILYRLYQHNGAWKLRIVDEVVADLQKLYGLSSPIFIYAPTVVTEKINELRQTETGQAIEQNLRTGMKIAGNVAQTVATGAKNTFTQVMGNSDEIAQRQKANEQFVPQKINSMDSLNLNQITPAIRNLHIGIGWKSKSGTSMLKGLVNGVKSVNVDLDLSAQLLTSNGGVVETVYYDNIRSRDLSVVHHGDASQGGNGLQDNEVISIALDMLPANVTAIAITATSNKGHLFSGLENGYLRLVNQQGMIPFAALDFDNAEQKSGCLCGFLLKNHKQEWVFLAVNYYFNAKNIQELSSTIYRWIKFIQGTSGMFFLPQQ